MKNVENQATGNRVHAVFDGLHQQFLHGDYRADYSQLHRTLDDGHFNCVTATILFRYLCERCDVRSEIIASPNHVLCRVPDDENQLIETTCPECHSASADQRFEHHSQMALSTSLRVISDVELVGKVFYNRGVAALESKQYSQAATLLVLARQFDRADAAARENLLGTLNNWALASCDVGDFETASHLIARGLAIDKTYAPLNSNDLHIHQQWVKSLCSQQQFAQAIEVLDTVIARHPDAKSFLEGRMGVYGKWSEALFIQGRFAAAWSVLDRVPKEPGFSCAEIESTAVLAAREKLLQSGQSNQAQKLLNEAAVRQPRNTELIRRKDLLQADL